MGKSKAGDSRGLGFNRRGARYTFEQLLAEIYIQTGYIEGDELSADAAAPGSNKGRLYFKDNGAGKTQLVVRFSSGAVQVIATEP